MFKLTVKRQAEYVVARCQDYRMVLELSEEEDPASSSSSSGDFEQLYQLDRFLFRVYREAVGVEHFDGIIEPVELEELDTDPIEGHYRTDTVDLYWPSKELADAGLEAIVEDLRTLLDNNVAGTVTVSLHGTSI